MTDQIEQTAGIPAAESLEQKQAQEKMLKQSEVNAMVGRVKREAYEQGKRDGAVMPNTGAVNTGNELNPAVGGVNPQLVGTQQHMGGMPNISDADISKIVDHRLNTILLQTQQQQAINSFVNKLEMAKSSHPDIYEKAQKLNLDNPNMMPLLHLLNGVENSGDVVADLADNPSKIGNIMSLYQHSPQLAQLETQNLANSIKMNKSAAQAVKPNEPLGQLSHSTIGADSGKLSISDLRKQSWLRG